MPQMRLVWFVACALLTLAAAAPAQQLEIRFLDVGQGDAALIREGGKNVLVDAGPSAIAADYLRSQHIDTLDLVIASHNHADHIGGMTAVFQSAVVRFYMDNGVPATTATYRRTMEAVAASGAQYLKPTDRTITLGDATVRIIPPPPGDNQNNASVGVLFEYGKFHALLTGDSEGAERTYWLNSGAIPRVNVIKVAHHGSNNGTDPEWVNATRPRVAVISVGAGNAYGHPSTATIYEWENGGARVYRTDLDGGVLILANDDGSYVVTTDRATPNGVLRVHPFAQDTTIASPAQPVVSPEQPAVAPSCCRVCVRGKACGNSCISKAYQCHQPPGCACNAKP